MVAYFGKLLYNRVMLNEHRIFWREFRETFRTTGAIAPSGKQLGRSLACFVRETGQGRRILEVGPGTGAVTARIVEAMRPGDHLDLVELNERFVQHLRHLFTTKAPFAAVADQVTIHHAPLQELQTAQRFDLVISGLPLNNFAVSEVQELLNTMLSLLKPGGVLSFFEYVALRRAKKTLVDKEERQRLRGIGQVLDNAFEQHLLRRDLAWRNLPPAWVHHLQTDAENISTDSP